MKRLFIFLDIDGVICKPINLLTKGCSFHPDCIKNLQYLIDEYDAHICFISSWRRLYDAETLFLILMGAGLRVPTDRRMPHLPTDNKEIRGPLIEDYIKERDIKPEEILILDDDSPYYNTSGPLDCRWVKTNCYDGLTFSRALEAERILKGEPKTRDALGTLLKTTAE